MDESSSSALVWLVLTIFIALVAFFVFRKIRNNKRFELKKLPLPKPLTFKPTISESSLDESKRAYERCLIKYKNHLNTNIDFRRRTNELLKEIENTIRSNFEILKRSKSLLKQPCDEGDLERKIDSFNLVPIELYLTKKVSKIHISPKIAILIGLVLGALILAITISLIVSLGHMPSGASISSLEGTAKIEAILEWVSGGDNIYIGLILSIIIFVIPALVLLYLSKVKLTKKTDELKIQTARLKDENERLEGVNRLLRQDIANRKSQYDYIHTVLDEVDELLYPNGKLTKLRRSIYSVFDKDFYTAEEDKAIHKLSEATKYVERTIKNKPPTKAI